jgi:hypothetical protein
VGGLTTVGGGTTTGVAGGRVNRAFRLSMRSFLDSPKVGIPRRVAM